MAISKSDARRLSMNVSEMGGQVLRGVLTMGPEGATVNGVNVLDWLTRHAGTELILIASAVGEAVTSDDVQTCQRCGRDFSGEKCPSCAEVRARLRG
jgi:hypothetical protein